MKKIIYMYILVIVVFFCNNSVRAIDWQYYATNEGGRIFYYDADMLKKADKNIIWATVKEVGPEQDEHVIGVLLNGRDNLVKFLFADGQFFKEPPTIQLTGDFLKLYNILDTKYKKVHYLTDHER